MMNNTPHHIIYILLLLLGAASPALAQTINGDVYGGGNLAQVKGSTTVNIIDGTVSDKTTNDGNIYGGGYGASAILTGNTTINISGGTVTKDVYGGGALANVTGSTTVNVSGGTITQDVYGGGALANILKDLEQELLGNTTVNLTGGTLRNSYGGGLGSNEVAALVEGNATVNLGVMVDDGEGNLSPSGTATAGNIFGCNNINGAPQGAVTVTTTSGTVNHNVYGGGNQAAASVNPIVNINGGIITENVYGGGYGTTAVITGNPVVTVTGGTVTQDVFGGGALANVTGSTTVNVSGGTVTQDVYGGGALANVSANTSVNLTGGTIGSAYGGGLGQLAAAAVGTEGDPEYQPAKEAVSALVGGDATTTLNGSKVTGSIFGANNVNGTPQGHVKVHVLATTDREGQTDGQYDVAAVYGGGNKAAYIPSEATFTANKGYAEVLIENCDNSIEYVYGGGNAAPVPATDVKIYGANAIDNAFAGGNGAGAGNPGADIGYTEYTRDEGHKYGAGTASITVYGGTVHNVFGGSNTLGYIAGGASVNVTQPDNDDPYDHDCTLNIGKVFGGGNEADMNCNIEMTCGCTEGVELLYAGANNADVDGNITLNILSGTYGQVFCGNNQGGAVRGSLTLNIDETGCWPIMIGELYGCGNEAAYSVYGYNDDKSCKTSGEKLYNDPVINIYSCTGIGRIFGGGKGSGATVYGNPVVNINTIKGSFAGQDVTPLYILDANCERIANNNALTIEDNVGKIGTVYGGGNQAAVHGNTTVNIGTLATNKHLNAAPETPNETVSVRITDNVFGGGKTAEVTGKATVTIGIDQQ